jgi:integrase
MRQGLGYKFVQPEVRLAGFVTFMEQRGVGVITRDLALEWAMQPINRRATWGIRLTDVRGFAQYLRSLDPRTEVPPAGILPSPSRCKPYLYSEAEIRDLLAAAFALPPSHALRRWTYHCLFGLLATTGLRISEALNLQDKDVDLKSGVLTIRDTKFGKSRLVPLHPTTAEKLRHYARLRTQMGGELSSKAFFVSERQEYLCYETLRSWFVQTTLDFGMRSTPDRRTPTIHGLRHHFAVERLTLWCQQGASARDLAPHMSVYLGHVSPAESYWYLSSTPGLLKTAADSFECYTTSHGDL